MVTTFVAFLDSGYNTVSKVETHMSTPLLRKRELLVSLRISRSDSVLSDRNLQECRH